MSLKETLSADMKTAMKQGNSVKVGVLRMMIAEIRKGEIDSRTEFSDDDVIKIVKKGIKSREESALMYEKGERADLVKKELEEIEFIKEYLPRQLDIAKVESIVERIIAEQGLTSQRDIGTIMGTVMKQYGAQVDGKTVQEVARLKLQNIQPASS